MREGGAFFGEVGDHFGDMGDVEGFKFLAQASGNEYVDSANRFSNLGIEVVFD